MKMQTNLIFTEAMTTAVPSVEMVDSTGEAPVEPEVIQDTEQCYDADCDVMTSDYCIVCQRKACLLYTSDAADEL